MEQVEETQRAVGQALKHVERIAAPQPNVREMPVADMGERRGDPGPFVELRLVAPLWALAFALLGAALLGALGLLAGSIAPDAARTGTRKSSAYCVRGEPHK